MPWRAFLLVLPLAAMRLIQEDPFPSCKEGILHLAGRYKVSSQITIDQSCRILAVNAVIVLEAQLFFQHDASFEGSIHFLGQDHRGGQQRCVEVEGDASFTKGKITFEDFGSPETEDGGGIYVEKNLAVSMSSLVFKNCRADFGGGAFVGESLTSTSSNISFASCHAPSGGGGMFAIGNVSVDSSSQLLFESCGAEKGEGGGLHVGGTFTTGGELSFKNCSAIAGGGLFMYGLKSHLSQEGGNITASDCKSTLWNGGGMHVMNLDQHAGHMDFRRCVAEMQGGGFCATKKVLLRGTSNFENISAVHGGAFFGHTVDVMGKVHTRNTRGSFGGAIFATKRLKISGGDVHIRDSSAMISGGALLSAELRILAGQVHIQDFVAVNSGGGIHLVAELVQLGGRIVLSNTSSTRGGGIRSTWLLQKAGKIFITNSHVRQFQDVFRKPAGGALELKRGLGQAQPGEIVIRNAFSESDGGGIITPMIVSHGTFTINNASAGGDGGCIRISQLVFDTFASLETDRHFFGTSMKTLQVVAARKVGVLKHAGSRRAASAKNARITMLVGNSTFEDCRAQIGGAIFTKGTVKVGEVAFSNCYASSIEGGAVLVAESAKFISPFHVTNCSTPKGAVFHVKRQLWIKNVTFDNCSAPQAAATLITAKRVVVRGGSSEAAFLGQHKQIDELHCDNSVEGFVDAYGTICRRCRTGYYQLQGGPKISNGTVAGHRCVKVPQQAVVTPDMIQLRPGYMLQASNFSMSLHCPNEMACPGGHVSKAGIENMCEKGYEGPGCVNCGGTHGRGSGDPFICSPCATSRFHKVADWTTYILQQTVVFAISASGVIFAGEESYKSTIYSNQLMAYVMVSLPVLRQLTNSKVFKTLAFFVQEMIEAFSIPVDVANGIGSEGQSVECLLDYVGISKTLYGGDLIFLMLALSLMLLLSKIVDVWSALVVAGNCYLPRLCFGFGRHLACYRLQSEMQDEQRCGFEKDVTMPRPVAAVLLVLCFIMGAGSWLWLIKHQEQIDSPGVAYLIQPCKQHCQNWEVTVLVRKVLLAVVCAVWPSSFNAAMQLEAIGIILVVSLVVTLQRSPYVSEEHNQTEVRLLVSAVLMVLTTFCFHANENSWARTESTQRSTLAFIVLLATGPALVMSMRIVLALIEEFRTLYREEEVHPKADNKEEFSSEAAS